MADPVLLDIAQKYFRSVAMYCNVHMWWTPPLNCGRPSSNLAQMYHFDMDRVKFLNFFLYVTDVDSNSGPHCYVKNSHNRKPKACLHDRRFTDEEITNGFGLKSQIEIKGPKGTLIAVDGRGFHKAKVPTKGNRLMFLSSMASSLFGQSYGLTPIAIKSKNMKEAYARDPRLCSAFTVSRMAEELGKRTRDRRLG